MFSIDEPSPTVRGVNRPVPPGYKKHNGDSDETYFSTLRPLTTIEHSYIQTFLKSFKFEGTKMNLEQMIGNAVPVNLAAHIAKSIKKYSVYKDNMMRILPTFEILNTNLSRIIKLNKIYF